MNTVIPLVSKESVIRRHNNKPYVFSQQDIHSYALACQKIINVINKEHPDVYVCPLRGAYPLTRIVLPYCVDNIKNIAYVTTSGFLLNRRDIIHSALETILTASSDKSKMLVTDTAITGSAIRDLRKILKKDLAELMPKKNIKTLNVILAKLWQGKQFSTNYACSSQHCKRESVINLFDYNFGVPNLFCEDDPDLLGIDYLADAKKGKKYNSLYEIISTRGIIVNDGFGNSKLHEGANDSNLFVQLIKKELNN